MTGEQILGMIEFFKGKPINDNVLKEYFNLNKIDSEITAETYPDFVYQYEFEQKLAKLHQKALETVVRLKPDLDFVTKAELDSTRAVSLGVEVDLMAYAEEIGLSPQETKNALANIMAVLQKPFVELERKIKAKEYQALEILLEQNGGLTIRNMNTILNDDAKMKGKA